MNLYPPVTKINTQPSKGASTTNRLLSHSPSSYSAVSASHSAVTSSSSSSSSSSSASSLDTPQHQSAPSALMQSASQPIPSISSQLERTNLDAAERSATAPPSFPTLDPSFLQFLDNGPPEVTERPLGPNDAKENSPPRLSLKHMTPDFSASVFSRLSYVLGENAEFLSEEHSVASHSKGYEESALFPCSSFRVERDYSLGEHCRFSLVFPPELSDKISPESFRRSISRLNDILHKAESSWLRNSLDNFLSCLTLYTSPLCFGTFYQKCMKELDHAIAEENRDLYLPMGLRMADPRRTGFLFLEIEMLEP
ncbi:hypothetical protein K493DRAFT_73286 [Basidiobolus meristosporus CBS 931.73]|uniref:Ras modification protein ERF4 n=1 Tax=Basidiobolus meristosporus CBS 931.73 TaxID=1314790 RepID=A0A1Y1XT99_9FUNG|nr:hypothetical protein K493DRAFT_73286 [Basidiobolus meristosporus CBS 931.73]|eukprot:ORX88925.1 hypothetical protein K493DRAFT_73286 [Basidiobolus meristosporus CBS 931.73]